MKKLIAFIAFIIPVLTANAQLNIGYVDSDTILNQLPDAVDAQKRLDAIIQEWQDELNSMERNLQIKTDDYEKRKLIMSVSTRVESEQELVRLEKEIVDFRQQKFGANGELFRKQDEFMKPIQNKVFNAIQEVAEENELDFVFDRSGDIVFLYAKDEYDITNQVLDKLR